MGSPRDQELGWDWRTIDWGNNQSIKKSLLEYKLSGRGPKHLRFLVHGPLAGGKSSVINSISSVLSGRIQVLAQEVPRHGLGSSAPAIFKEYHMKDKDKRPLPFVFSDVPGLTGGHCKEIHPVLLPLRVRAMEKDLIKEMKDIRVHASALGIPQALFVTHVDEFCLLVREDLRRIYSSKNIKTLMQECSNSLGVPMNCIFPVKNYHEQNTLDSNMDSLLLDALKNAVNFARDYVDRLEVGAGMAASTSQLSSAVAQGQHKVTTRSAQGQGSVTGAHLHQSDREFDLEWRNVNWDITARNRMERELREFRLLIPDLKHLCILLHGPVGGGKSSFINSIDSVFQGQVSARALVATGAGASFTKKYKTHTFRNGNSGYLPFVVNDIMGLEEASSAGTHPNDIISALKGHVKSNHKFNPVSPLSVGDPDYNPNPTLSDRVHCLVSVVSMDAFTLMKADNKTIAKMQAVREAASDMDIPQAVVMTMVDKDTLVAEKGLRKIYSSKKIKQKMEMCSTKLGVPMNCIFPVKNYHEETELHLEMDCLILTALRQIVHFAHEYVDSVDV
ncbi:hypothetical protein ACEWY4_004804 [Coilia grayii]|uniref:Interferon-induced protein 44-like n=1 Tax=Coilia grayii TaxID=363190 RepID=A0ABD1KMJ9_9TELE